MEFTPLALSKPLSDQVEALFHYQHYHPEHRIERVVPTGHIHLIFALDGFRRHTYSSSKMKPEAFYDRVWISGMHRKSIHISAHPDSEMLVVQFKAFGAFPFLKTELNTFNDRVLPAEEVLGKEVLDLQEALMGLDSPAEKLERVRSWLLERYEADFGPSEELKKVVSDLQSAPGDQFGSVIASWPRSQKNLIDQFKKYVGLTPKYYQRILRFNEILQHINNKKKLGWTGVAYHCGFSDQSHFIKDFKHFSGFNPKEFIAENFGEERQNFFPIDRPG